MTLDLKLLVVHIVDSLKSWSTFFGSRRVLARLLSTFLCCVVVVIRPFSSLGGSSAFLVLALKELVFSVQDSLAQQLELTVLNILGAFAGIGTSTLAKYIAAQYPEDSTKSRATCAVFLVLISFFAGLVKSHLPRLNLSMRISCFVSIWILTNGIGVPSQVLSASGDFLWITLSAAIICVFSLLAVMLLRHWSVTNFERDIASTFVVIQACLRLGLALAFPHPNDPPVNLDEYQKLKVNLLNRSVKLNENYSQAAFELRIGRLSLRSIRPLIGVAEHLRREIAWGMPLRKRTAPARHTISPTFHGHFFQSPPVTPLPSPPLSLDHPIVEVLEGPAQALGSALLEATQCVEQTIVLAFHQADPPARLFSWRPNSSEVVSATSSKLEAIDAVENTSHHGWTFSQLAAIQKVEANLVTARDNAREQLRTVFRDVHAQNADDPHRQPLIPKEALTCCLAMIALLQMAQEARVALQVAHRFTTRYETSRPRLWYPRFSLSWLGVPPGPFVSDDPNVHPAMINGTSDAQVHAADDNYEAPEWRQGLREHASGIGARRAAMNTARMSAAARGSQCVEAQEGDGWTLSSIVEWMWSNRRMLKLRMRMWRLHRSFRHSSHLKHAFKNACGVAVLGFPAFLPNGSAGKKWFTDVHGQWMVISYLWVLETNTGATWRTGYLRILGTCLGALYAYITWLICKTNPYGLVTLVVAADIPITWLITKTSLGPLAVPASVALPPIVFARYINPTSSQPIIILSLLRAAMISTGMVAALLMNSLVFPRHARVYFLLDTSRTLGLLTDLYLALSHDVVQDRHVLTQEQRRKTLKLELEIRNSLNRLSAQITAMHNELSLLPKPLRHYRRVVTVLQNTLDLMTGLRKIRENIPRKLCVAEVFNERREFMSCVCIALFACQHAFRAREPLPQFLPSARHAFDTLEEHIHARLKEANDEDPQALGLSAVYAFAEQQVMRSMVDTLEALLDVTGSLFGTSAWLTHDGHVSAISTRVEDGDHGWYSTFRWEEG